MRIVQVENQDKIYHCITAIADDMFNQEVNNSETIKLLSQKFSKNGQFIVAEENDEIVGVAGFYCNDMIRKMGFLSMIIVRSCYQKKGIGLFLLETVERMCIDAGMNKLRLEVDIYNIVAQKFYITHGFSNTERIENSLYMEKSLTF